MYVYFFLKLEKVAEQKLAHFFLRLVSILFLIFEKGRSKKLCYVLFKICKYTFLIFEKGDEQKFRLFFFKICKYTFFNISNGWSAKNWARFFLRFVSIPFLIFEKVVNKKLGKISFKISQKKYQRNTKILHF